VPWKIKICDSMTPQKIVNLGNGKRQDFFLWNNTLNHHYIYEIIFLVDFFSLHSHIFLIEMMVIWGFGWLKQVFKCHEGWFKNHVPLCNFIEEDSIGVAIFVQIVSYFTNKINYVLYDGTYFKYDKSSNFVVLMLKSWNFS
jgi:hypothetical protein